MLSRISDFDPKTQGDTCLAKEEGAHAKCDANFLKKEYMNLAKLLIILGN